MQQYYSIGQAAGRLNCNTSVLRFYEDYFALDIQRSASRRRIYTEEEISLFKKIQDMRGVGMTLTQIKNNITGVESINVFELESDECLTSGSVEKILNELKEIKSALNVDGYLSLKAENEELKEKLKQKSFEVIKLKEEIEYLKSNRHKRKFF